MLVSSVIAALLTATGPVGVAPPVAPPTAPPVVSAEPAPQLAWKLPRYPGVPSLPRVPSVPRVPRVPRTP